MPAPVLEEIKDLSRRAIEKAIARIERRIAAIRADFARIEEAEAVASRARLFVPIAATTPRGARTMSVVDWSGGQPRTIELALDPAKGARETLDAMFRRAKRLRRGEPILAARLESGERTVALLRSIAGAVEGAETVEDVVERMERARVAAPRDVRALEVRREHRSRPDAPALPYRSFLTPAGARILVGKSAEKNDALTLHVARPHDLWLHAKGYVGSHIVVPLPKNTVCPSELLVAAAHLAAHFSDARGEAVVEVSYVPKRYVRKPRGSAPGLVTLAREKVLVLRKDDALLRRLLEREEIAP